MRQRVRIDRRYAHPFGPRVFRCIDLCYRIYRQRQQRRNLRCLGMHVIAPATLAQGGQQYGIFVARAAKHIGVVSDRAIFAPSIGQAYSA